MNVPAPGDGVTGGPSGANCGGIPHGGANCGGAPRFGTKFHEGWPHGPAWAYDEGGP